MALRRILAPVDGSDLATRALDFAIERAKLHGASISVAFSVNRLAVATATANPYGYADPTPLLEALEEEAAVVLAAAGARVAKAGIPVERLTLDGLPAPAILACANDMKPDAIVMGTHGRGGFARFALGSAAEAVVRAAADPVFVVSGRAGERAHPGALASAIVAIDGSPAADLAVSFACELAAVEKTALDLCAVVEPSGSHGGDLEKLGFLGDEAERRASEMLAAYGARASAVGIPARTTTLRGDPASEILGQAYAGKADCIFVGTHGRAGLPRLLLGSVAEGILRSSPVPVCVVRHR